jgi:anti-anti-sigma regulatory factor
MEIKTRFIDDVVIFVIEGDYTRVTATPPTLYELAKDQLREGKRKILFNFEKAGFVDSFGVREIIQTFTSTKDLGGSFKLVFSRQLRLALEITKLVPDVLDAYPTEEAALASFAALPRLKGA